MSDDRLQDLELDAHLRDPSIKQRYVTTLFDTIAPRYDRFTRLFSLGMDRRWKRDLVACASSVLPAGGVALDVACGSGDLAFALGRAADCNVLGIDPSPAMLAVARRRATHDGSASVRFLQGDMMTIPLRDRSADAVTAGYGLRNAPHCSAALREIRRVLKPGGWLFTLDFFKPTNRLWRRAYLAYLGVAGRLVGRAWHGSPDAYGYIAKSLRHWFTPEEYEAELRGTGFVVRRARRKLGGGIAVHAAQRR